MKAALFIFSLLTLSSLCEASCLPEPAQYKQSLKYVLTDFFSRDENSVIGLSSGRLGVSVVNDEVIDQTSEGYTSRVTLRSSYGQLSDEFGVKVRKTVYVIDAINDCKDFEIKSVFSEPSFEIEADMTLSQVVKAAMKSYFDGNDIIPMNSHSGDHSLRIHTPVICSDGKYASVNVLRSHHGATGILRKVSSFLVNLNTKDVEEVFVRPGQILTNMCKAQ